MGQLFLYLLMALTIAAIIFGVTVLVSGNDPALVPAEPDGRAVPLPGSRPLLESDISDVRFDTAVRGYRMAQVDQALRRAAYDIGYKEELIGVLEAEVVALREGRLEDADALRKAREEALSPPVAPEPEPAAESPTVPISENNDKSVGTPQSAAEPAPPVKTGEPATAAEPADQVDTPADAVKSDEPAAPDSTVKA